MRRWLWWYYLDPLTYTCYGALPAGYAVRYQVCHLALMHRCKVLRRCAGLVASQLGDVNDKFLTLEDGRVVSVSEFVFLT